ncbi:hypothetical protein OSB04_024678, partial [Centaurea solstitialis]
MSKITKSAGKSNLSTRTMTSSATPTGRAGYGTRVGTRGVADSLGLTASSLTSFVGRDGNSTSGSTTSILGAQRTSQYHLIREIIGRGDLRICKILTDENVVDPLTKPLARAKHEGHASSIGIQYLDTS